MRHHWPPSAVLLPLLVTLMCPLGITGPDSRLQFRSSRSNRHLQHENLPRNRGGAGGPIDHDPTEGLPVKKWQLTDVTVKQKENDDDGDDTKTGNVNPDYPWPELPLPKDFHQLPLHSQVSRSFSLL